MKITQRDKKLLIFLAWFVLIFCGLFWVIRPLWSRNQSLKSRIEEERFEQESKQRNVQYLPVYEKQKTEVSGELAREQAKFYERMPGSEIDRLLTGMALSHGLVVNDLSFDLPEDQEYASLSAYTVGEEISPQPEGGTREETPGQPAAVSQDWMGRAGAADDSFEGVYAANVQMTMTGERRRLQALLDECASLAPKLRVDSLEWVQSGNGEGDSQLRLALELYMYEEEAAYSGRLQKEQESHAE